MKSVNIKIAWAFSVLLIVLLVGLANSCGGASPQVAEPSDGQPSIEQLTDFLYSEMERLGVDPNRTSSAALAGNEVFDLSARLVDPDGDGPEAPVGIELNWTERLVGDYDQNGEVGLSDLTPIAIHYNSNVNYDPADERSGIKHWPSGDPDNGGATNWRKARVDGDSNGEVNIADVTQIALHWGERIEGYKLYERSPEDADFSVVPNADDPDSDFTIPRLAASSIDPGKPVRYQYMIEFEIGGEYEFQLSKFDSIDGEGGMSEACSYNNNEPPVAVISAYPISGTAPLTVAFDASGSYDPDGYYVWFEWDFDGDGVYDLDSGMDSTVTNTYDTPGEYDATVRVRDYPGDTDTASVLITVNEGPTGPPVAVLTAYPISGNAPLTVAFDASGSSDPDGGGLQYDWDFDGDGVYDLDGGTEPTASYTYGTPGEYDATVMVTDPDGDTDTASVLITVGNGGGSQDPEAHIVADYLSVYAPTYVRFDASGSFDTDGEIVNYRWSFESNGAIDIDTGAYPKAATIYLSSGVRYATVYVTDDAGNTDSASVGLSIEEGNDRLFVLPDPLDNDWQDAVGYGVYYEPYIVVSEEYNVDMLTEFSMVAYWYENDGSTSIPVDELTWVGYPPSNCEWVAPGTFTATAQTIGNVYAYGMIDPIRTSVQLFIRNTATYPY